MKTALYLPNHLGDSVIASSIIPWIKSERGSEQIILIGNKYLEGIFRDFPGTETFIPVEKNRRGFFKAVHTLKRENVDRCFILPKSFSSALIAALAQVKARIGYCTDSRGFLLTEKHLPVDPKKRHLRFYYFKLFHKHLLTPPPENISFFTPIPNEKTKNVLEKQNKFITVDTGAVYGEAKMWEDVKWIELIKQIENFVKVLILGTRDLSAWKGCFKNTLNLSSKTEIKDLPYILSKSSLHVSCDTGSMHLAAALGVDTVSLFGSSSPVWTSPWGKGQAMVIYKHLSCSPCFKKKCPRGEPICMKAIEVDEVLDSILKTLKVDVLPVRV
ncbi:glycosyltransferase family 9 protein [candidate division WOR-3 bacterium]|nr:glycosyltransferase family 9 protein [candidate division WOR-3 bacterium]